MDLTPEEKKIGKENFNQVVGTTRRDFLMGTLATGVTTGAGLGSMYFEYDAQLDDPLRIGIIGKGDEGNVLIGALNPDFVDVVAIADIRPYNLHRAFYGDFSSPGAMKARPGLLKVYQDKYGWKDREEAEQHITVYADKYQDMLENDDVEAVIIALPLWLHDVAAIEAMKAGKHVLTEKLMAQTVGKCKEMARVAQQTNKVLATGHQRHYSILYRQRRRHDQARSDRRHSPHPGPVAPCQYAWQRQLASAHADYLYGRRRLFEPAQKNQERAGGCCRDPAASRTQNSGAILLAAEKSC